MNKTIKQISNFVFNLIMQIKKSINFDWNKFLHFLKKFTKEIIIALVLALVAAIWVEKNIESVHQNLLKQNLKAVAIVVVYDSNGNIADTGSGIFVSSDGTLVTNYHVIEGAKGAIVAKMETGAYYTLQHPIGYNKDLDLAVLKFDAKDIPYIKEGDSDKIEIGDKVFTIGSPLGIGNSVTEGIISYPHRSMEGVKDLIQFTAPISSGNSGGGLFNMKGEAIGITAMSLTIPSDLKKEVDAQNLNFAVPINDVRKALSGEEVMFSQDSPEFLYSKGMIAKNKKDYAESIRYFNKAIDKDDTYIDAYLDLGDVYYEQRQYDLEIQTFEKAIKLDPSNPDSFYYLGTAYEDKGMYDLAIKTYKKVLALKPDYKDALYQLGIDYLVIGSKDQALNLVPKLSLLDEGLAKELKLLIERMKLN